MSLANAGFEEVVYGTPITLLFAGTLAVAIFFVMSGFVLAIGFFKKGDDEIVKRLAAGRYLRLMIPSLVTVLLAHAFILINTNALISQAADLAGSPSFANKWTTRLSLFDAVKSGVFDIFVYEDAVQLNGVLWTMYIEFVGSFMVFGFLLLFARSRHRWMIYAVLVAFTFDTWFLSFIIGTIIADLYTHKRLRNLARTSVVIPVALGAVFFGIFPKSTAGTIYSPLDVSAFGINNRILYLTLSATLFLLLVLLSERVAGWLKGPRISRLGKYTFSLYLVHLFVIYTVSSFVIVQTSDALGYNLAALLSAVVSTPVLCVATVLFERHVDTPAVQIARYMGEVYREKEPFAWRRALGFVPLLAPLTPPPAASIPVR